MSTDSKKFRKIDSGWFKRGNKEYEYDILLDDNKPIKNDNVRIRIVKSKPVVKEVTTRYDPEISIDGDAGSVLPVSLGYSMESIKFTKSVFWILTFGMISIFTTPLLFIFRNSIPSIETTGTVLYVAYGLLIVLFPLVGFCFYKIVKLFISTFANYLKARHIEKMLKNYITHGGKNA